MKTQPTKKLTRKEKIALQNSNIKVVNEIPFISDTEYNKMVKNLNEALNLIKECILEEKSSDKILFTKNCSSRFQEVIIKLSTSVYVEYKDRPEDTLSSASYENVSKYWNIGMFGSVWLDTTLGRIAYYNQNGKHLFDLLSE